jgi:hypothetical protein
MHKALSASFLITVININGIYVFSQPVFALSPYCCVLSEEATNIIF